MGRFAHGLSSCKEFRVLLSSLLFYLHWVLLTLAEWKVHPECMRTCEALKLKPTQLKLLDSGSKA